MADELLQKYQTKADIVRLSGGIFEVYRDDELIFSKRKLGRFPRPGEVTQLIDLLEGGTPLADAQSQTSSAKPSGGFLSRLLGRA